MHSFLSAGRDEGGRVSKLVKSIYKLVKKWTGITFSCAIIFLRSLSVDFEPSNSLSSLNLWLAMSIAEAIITIIIF